MKPSHQLCIASIVASLCAGCSPLFFSLPSHVVQLERGPLPQWLVGEWIPSDELTEGEEQQPSWNISKDTHGQLLLHTGNEVFRLDAAPVKGQPDMCLLEMSLIKAEGQQQSGAIYTLCMATFQDGLLTLEPLGDEMVEGWEEGPGIAVYSQDPN